MLSRLRIYLSRMFEAYLYTAEGFRITKQKYVVPEETISLPAVKKRAITISTFWQIRTRALTRLQPCSTQAVALSSQRSFKKVSFLTGEV